MIFCHLNYGYEILLQLEFKYIQVYNIKMRRKPCEKTQEEKVLMTEKNLAICLKNQEGFENKQLNDSLHLQYYGFCEINNLSPFKNLHTIFLNNNVLEQINNLELLTTLTTLNLAYNRIQKFKGLKSLGSLHTLDLSNNFIEEILQEEIIGLNKLSILKIGQNKLSSYLAIKPITILNKSLTCLQLNGNQNFPFDQLFYTEFLPAMSMISVLSLQKTTLNREVPSYRKETICASNSLLFLDDRPVTEDERMLAKAWKEGGLLLQKDVRQRIKEKLEEKHSKIYAQMQERTKIADQKRKLAYNKLTHREKDLLDKLISQKQSQDYQLLSQDQKNELKLRIQELQQYLSLMVGQMEKADVDKILNDGRLEVPKMIIDKQTPEAIYIYNISQQLLPLIKQKYYPQQTRQLIAVSSTSQSQSRWIKQYDALLLDCYNQTRGNQKLLVPTFNLSLYEFDKSTNRKIKRFQIDELKQYLRKNTEEQDIRQKSIEVLYELD